jgi:hypothetical protein
MAAATDTWLRTRVEALSVDDEVFRSQRPILFIDSSHAVRAGGDAPFLLNRLVPSLPPGTLVHVHDVFTPYDYPDAYRRRLYGEQYVLQALLSHAPRFRVVFATHHMARRYTAELQGVFGAVVGADQHCGASLWFEIVDA